MGRCLWNFAVMFWLWRRGFGDDVQQDRTLFRGTRRAVFAGRAVGLAREGLMKFCALMDMPPPLSTPTYQAHQHALLVAAQDVAKRSLDQAAAAVREKGESEGSTSPSDIAVTFDGTWMKRGHTSMHGVTTVISLSTGDLLDYTVYSKYCHACSRRKAAVSAGHMTAAEFANWETGHVNDCSRRFRLFFPTISRITTWNANYPKINERFSSFKRCSHGAASHAPKNMYMHILRACLPWNPIR